MCLYTRKPKPFVSRKEQSVYKVLVKKGNTFLTPYRDAIVPEDGTMDDAENLVHPQVADGGYYEIEEGMIHSFLHLKDAKAEADFWSRMDNRAYVFKVTIPIGVQYYKGKYGMRASKKLIINLKEEIYVSI